MEPVQQWWDSGITYSVVDRVNCQQVAEATLWFGNIEVGTIKPVESLDQPQSKHSMVLNLSKL